MPRLFAFLALIALAAPPAIADTLRIATFSAALSRDGPGLLLRDMQRDDPQIAAVVQVVARTAPDILFLTDIDWDAGGAALTQLAALLRRAGAPDYPYRLALRPNSGMQSGQDLDGDGWLGAPRDAQGYGRFTGDGGLALLSRLPLAPGLRDLSDMLWRNLPGATLPRRDGMAFPSEAAQQVWRLSSTGHWVVPLARPDGPPLTLLLWAATPPVFDGPEDANGLRSRDELRLWQVLLDGGLGPVPQPPFVIAGNANIDPEDGDGHRAAIAALLADPRLTDPAPSSPGGAAAADPGQRGDPSRDTADWPAAPDGPGNLRVDYLLPSAEIAVTGAGVWWPTDPEAAETAALASAHRLVWIDIALP